MNASVYQLLARWCPSSIKSAARALKNKAWGTDDVQEVLRRAYCGNGEWKSRQVAKLRRITGSRHDSPVIGCILSSYDKIRGSQNGSCVLEEEDPIEHVREMDASSRSVREWRSLYDALFASGLFQACCTTRAKLKDRIHSNAKTNKSKNILSSAFAAYFEDADLENCERILRDIRSHRFLSQDAKARYTFYTRVLSKNRSRMSALADSFLGYRTKSYKQFIDGGSVAVVGPARVDEDYSSEIDAHDIVVRFNCLSDDVGNEAKGERTDVVYYTGVVAGKVSTGEAGYPRSAKWFAVREGKHVRELEQKSDVLSRGCSELIPLLNGALNMVPLAVVDLLHLNSSKISIYGTNFYLDRQLYGDEYLTDSNVYNKNKMVKSFVAHDSLSNFKLVKNLYEMGYVQADQQLQQVLKLSGREYMTALKRIHVERRSTSSPHA